MYKKILIPTDGFGISSFATRARMALDRQIEAEGTGIFIAAGYRYPIYVEVVPSTFWTGQECREPMRKTAALYRAAKLDATGPADVRFSAFTVFSMRSSRTLYEPQKTMDLT
jgi:hypothetical protein